MKRSQREGKRDQVVQESAWFTDEGACPNSAAQPRSARDDLRKRREENLPSPQCPVAGPESWSTWNGCDGVAGWSRMSG